VDSLRWAAWNSIDSKLPSTGIKPARLEIRREVIFHRSGQQLDASRIELLLLYQKIA